MQNTAVNLYLDSHQCEKNSADKIAIV